jgi:hypothetical protein
MERWCLFFFQIMESTLVTMHYSLQNIRAEAERNRGLVRTARSSPTLVKASTSKKPYLFSDAAG